MSPKSGSAPATECRKSTATASPVTRKAPSLPSTSHISFVLWCYSKMTWENLSPVLSSAEQWVSLQPPFYLSLPSTTCLVTPVIEKVTGDKSSKVFHETGFSTICNLSLPHQATCHLSYLSLCETGPWFSCCQVQIMWHRCSISTVYCSVLVTGNTSFNCMEIKNWYKYGPLTAMNMGTHICVCVCVHAHVRMAWGGVRG